MTTPPTVGARAAWRLKSFVERGMPFDMCSDMYEMLYAIPAYCYKPEFANFCVEGSTIGRTITLIWDMDKDNWLRICRMGGASALWTWRVSCCWRGYHDEIEDTHFTGDMADMIKNSLGLKELVLDEVY